MTGLYRQFASTENVPRLFLVRQWCLCCWDVDIQTNSTNHLQQTISRLSAYDWANRFTEWGDLWQRNSLGVNVPWPWVVILSSLRHSSGGVTWVIASSCTTAPAIKVSSFIWYHVSCGVWATCWGDVQPVTQHGCTNRGPPWSTPTSSTLQVKTRLITPGWGW